MKDNKFKWIASLMNVLITISIIIISTVCLIGMILCIISFIHNQKSFNDTYTSAINAIISAVHEDETFADETVSTIITHLENLQVIQKNSITNDLMSFVYGILSTILVGLCAGFVTKSKKSADESKETARQAQEDAQTVQSTKKSILKIKNDLIYEARKSKKLRTSAEKQIKIQNSNAKLLEIHIAIAHTKMSLYLCNQVEANSRIYHINESINSFDGFFDKQAMKQLRDELLILKSSVDEFKNNATQKYTNGKQVSMLQATARYYKELDESIAICDRIILN